MFHVEDLLLDEGLGISRYDEGLISKSSSSGGAYGESKEEQLASEKALLEHRQVRVSFIYMFVCFSVSDVVTHS